MADIADSIADNAPSRTPCPSPEAAGDAPKWRLEASPSPSPPHSGGQLPLSPCPLPPSPLPLTSAPLRHGACRPRRLAGGAPPVPASRKWPPSAITAPCRGAPRYPWGMRGPFGVPSRPLVARSSLGCVFPPREELFPGGARPRLVAARFSGFLLSSLRRACDTSRPALRGGGAAFPPKKNQRRSVKPPRLLPLLLRCTEELGGGPGPGNAAGSRGGGEEGAGAALLAAAHPRRAKAPPFCSAPVWKGGMRRELRDRNKRYIRK